MNIFITYSDEKYAEARHFCARMARWLGRFDKTMEFSPENIDIDFKKMHSDIFAFERGAGLWLWKPYLILKVLKEVAKDGDVVFYSDAGTFFIRPFSNILRTMKEDVWVSNIPLSEKQFTKKETFALMGCQGEKYEETPQVQGGFVGIRKSDISMRFVEEWLNYSSNYRIISPVTNPDYPEIDSFIAHREDQSVLSLLCKKHGITPHKDLTQFGRFPEKYSRPKHLTIENNQPVEYPTMIILHRQKSVNLKVIIPLIMNAILPCRIVKLFLSKEYYKR